MSHRPFKGTSPQDVHHTCSTRPLCRFAPGHGRCLSAVILSCIYSPSLAVDFRILVDQPRMICVPVDLDQTQCEGLSCVNLDMPALLSYYLSSKLPCRSVIPHIADFASTFWLLPLCVSQFHLLPGGGVLLSVEFWKFVCSQWNIYLLRCGVANVKPVFAKSLAVLGRVCRGIKFFSGFF